MYIRNLRIYFMSCRGRFCVRPCASLRGMSAALHQARPLRGARRGKKKTCRRGPETGHRVLRRQDCSVGRLCDGRSGSLSEDVGGRDFPHAALERVAVPCRACETANALAFGCVGEPEVVGEAELHLAQDGQAGSKVK